LGTFDLDDEERSDLDQSSSSLQRGSSVESDIESPDIKEGHSSNMEQKSEENLEFEKHDC
jgi:hypothetical protein